jgi:hypothetical protein
MGLQPLDGPATYASISVTTTPIELKVGGSPFDERKVVTLQPIDGRVYYGYDNSVSSSTGTLVFKKMIYPLEVSPDLPVWLVADSGTVDVRITEVA